MKGKKGKQLVQYEGRKKEIENYFSSSEIQREYDAHTDKEPGLRDYLDVLLKRKQVLALCIVIPIVIVVVGSLLMSPTYKAEATLEIAPENPKITTFQEVIEIEPQYQQTESFYGTQYELLKSKSLAKEVINTLDLDSHPEFQGGGLISFITGIFSAERQTDKEKLAGEQKLIESFLGKVEVSPDTDSRLVRVSFLSSDPELAAKATNTLTDKYIEWTLERRLEATKAAKEFLQKQLEQVKAKLETAEKELNTFAESANIISLDKNLNLVYKQLAELNDALSKAETERLSKEALYKEVQSGNYAYLPQVISDSSIKALNEEHIKLKARYDNLDALYDYNYPQLKQLAAQIKGVESDIEGYRDKIAESIKKDYQTALQREQIIRQRTEEQEGRTALLNEKANQYKILEREVDTNKSIYQDLLQRLKETEVTSGIRTTNIQVVDYASIPLQPYKPNILLNTLIAALVGIMAGVFLAFVSEHFDNTIKDEEEVKKRYALPFLGVVPLVTDENKLEGLETAVYRDPRSLVSEAFRMIRTSIMYSSANRPPKSLLVTSAQPSEGKTISASNLALSMIQSGRKVILVDADLRRPRLHELFSDFLGNGNGNGSGLSAYLAGEKRLPSVVYRTSIAGLDLILAGPIPPNPTELLSSEKMKRLLRGLRKKYDYVILDGTPVMSFADSRLLSRFVDGVVLVTSVGVTQRQSLDTCIEEILNVKGKIIGTVVNRLESSRNKYGYNYYYYDDEKIRRKEAIGGPKTEPAARRYIFSAILKKDIGLRSALASLKNKVPVLKSLVYSALLTVGTLVLIFYATKSDLPFYSEVKSGPAEKARGEGKKDYADKDNLQVAEILPAAPVKAFDTSSSKGEKKENNLSPQKKSAEIAAEEKTERIVGEEKNISARSEEMSEPSMEEPPGAKPKTETELGETNKNKHFAKSGDTDATRQDGKYTVQIGAFKAEEKAKGIADKLASKGYPAFVETLEVSPKVIWHAIRVGTFETEEEAQSYGDSLKDREPLVEEATVMLRIEETEKQTGKQISLGSDTTNLSEIGSVRNDEETEPTVGEIYELIREIKADLEE